MKTPTKQIRRTVMEAFKTGELVTVLTGAGVSAESGIPTFRGPEGYWTVGSKNYQPSEIATKAMFNRNREEVWKWFLFRRGVYGLVEGCLSFLVQADFRQVTQGRAAKLQDFNGRRISRLTGRGRFLYSRFQQGAIDQSLRKIPLRGEVAGRCGCRKYEYRPGNT